MAWDISFHNFGAGTGSGVSPLHRTAFVQANHVLLNPELRGCACVRVQAPREMLKPVRAVVRCCSEVDPVRTSGIPSTIIAKIVISSLKWVSFALRRGLIVAAACVCAFMTSKSMAFGTNHFVANAQEVAYDKVKLYNGYNAPKIDLEKEKKETSSRSSSTGQGEFKKWRYSQFIEATEDGQLLRTLFSSDMKRCVAVTKDGAGYRLDALPDDKDLIPTLRRNKVDISIMPLKDERQSNDFFRSAVVPGVIFGLLFYLTRRLQNGGLGPMNSVFDLQKSGARFSMVPHTGVVFKDVAGMDSAKIELEELVQFLKESERFTELGATIPRGVIVEGPPGTGKTLLARAVAGEAAVPFFSISGSEFVEMFVGVGASRVRDLFTQAKKNAPCIIFIDEIDAVGRQRGSGFAGGNDEREQTLNQLLTEMDGFEGNMGIIVMAATNRSDVLDKALLRPGRFDRRISVGLPDFNGRVAILHVHAKGKPFATDVEMQSIARRTPGFSGAGLQNLLNEAAICAARNSKTEIAQDHIDTALERIMLGAEKKHESMPEDRRRLIAYHEAGHALVGALVPDYDAVHKISIVPRGAAGGLTFFAPDENRVESSLYSRQFLEGQLATALGGRVSEEIVFGEAEVTTGAADDLQQVTRIARQMVTKFGFSDRVGQVVVSSDGGMSGFMRRRQLPGESAEHEPSMDLRRKVDNEVTELVMTAYNTAKDILTKNRHLLESISELLLKQETVSAEELQQLIAKEEKVYMVPYLSSEEREKVAASAE